MILHIKSHMTSFEHSVPATYEGIKSLFDMFPFVEQIVAHHHNLNQAVEEIVEYLNSHHMDAWLSAETPLKKSEDKTRVASIVVCSGDKMLMLQRRDNDKWTFPGGHLNDDESFIDGAVRELFEEAGIKANPDELILLGDKQTFQGKTIHVYLYKVNNEVATTASNDPDKEAKQFKWLPHILPEEIKENLYIPVGDNASLSIFMKYLLSQKVSELKSKLKKD